MDYATTIELIAPCGMNCMICSSYLALQHNLRLKGILMPTCSGCRPRDKKCAFIKKRCDHLMKNEVRYCYECETYPCEQLQKIDKRYRTLFRMSMIENLEVIKQYGVEKFLENDYIKWKCPECGGMRSCHNGICFQCGSDKLRHKKKLYRWEEE